MWELLFCPLFLLSQMFFVFPLSPLISCLLVLLLNHSYIASCFSQPIVLTEPYILENNWSGTSNGWLMSCYITRRCQSSSREKQLTLLAIYSTKCISNLILRKLLMNSEEEKIMLSNTLGYLAVTVIFCVIGRT